MEKKHLNFVHQAEYWQCGSFRLSMHGPAHVMGIINMDPDSFSGDGLRNIDAALRQAEGFVKAGAAILDIGGQSTRPGAPVIAAEEELGRVMPLIESLIAEGFPVPISVDTSAPLVIEESIRAGVHIINDVRGLAVGNALELVARSDVGAVIMHSAGEPAIMQIDPHYDDVVVEIADYLSTRSHAAYALGMAAERIVLDPGLCFGKLLDHNKALLRYLPIFLELGHPILIGASRKSMLGDMTGRILEERLAAGIATHLFAVHMGAKILRVHDVKELVDAVNVWHQLATFKVL